MNMEGLDFGSSLDQGLCIYLPLLWAKSWPFAEKIHIPGAITQLRLEHASSFSDRFFVNFLLCTPSPQRALLSFC
jgi:hypothetical protein